jgi:DNA repair exonuclease SbcCD nuclease subunit
MKAIILGDVHLGKANQLGKVGIGSNLNSRVVDQVNLLEWTLERAIEHHSEDIIITGDIFEEPKPHPTIITIFINWLKRCEAEDVNVHIIMGNHDLLRSGNVSVSPLDIISEMDLDNVSVYKEISTIFIGNTAFTLMPFKDRKFFGTNSSSEAVSLLKDTLVYELASIPATYKKVVIGHLAIEGSIPVGDEIDDLTNELFCPLDMFNGYDYVWMGHVHKPQEMNKSDPYIAHIGSMDISNFGEADQKKFIVVFDCIFDGIDNVNNEIWGINYLPTRALKKINVVIPQDIEDTTQYVLDYIKNVKHLDKSIVKVEVSLSDQNLKPVNKSIIEKYLTSHGVFNVNSITESKKAILIKKDSNNSIDTKMDVSSAIKTYARAHVDENEQNNFIELAMEIYNNYKLEAKD